MVSVKERVYSSGFIDSLYIDSTLLGRSFLFSIFICNRELNANYVLLCYLATVSKYVHRNHMKKRMLIINYRAGIIQI